MTRLIDNPEALHHVLGMLAARDPLMGELMALGAVPPLRKREPGFPGLAGIVVAQQVSTASARAIWSRFEACFPGLDPAAIAGSSDDAMRAAGLSAPKIRTLRAVAEAICAGGLALETLADMPGEAAHAALTRISGIGPWTADIYLLFCLGHPDVFPAGDLALQEAARIALRLAQRPDEATMAALARQWQPWRGAAAYLLWAYYAVAKRRDGAPMSGAAPAETSGAFLPSVPLPQPRDRFAAYRLAEHGAPEGSDRMLKFAEDHAARAVSGADGSGALIEALLSDSAPLRRTAATALTEILQRFPDTFADHGDVLVSLAARDDGERRGPLLRALAYAELKPPQRRKFAGLLQKHVDSASGQRWRELDQPARDERIAALDALLCMAERDDALQARLAPWLAQLAQTGSLPLRQRLKQRQR